MSSDSAQQADLLIMLNTHTLQLQCAGAVKAAVVSQLEWIPHSCLWNQWLLFLRKNTHTHIPTHKQHSVWEKTHTHCFLLFGREKPTPLCHLLSSPNPPLFCLLPSLMRPMWSHKQRETITTWQRGFVRYYSSNKQNWNPLCHIWFPTAKT